MNHQPSRQTIARRSPFRRAAAIVVATVVATVVPLVFDDGAEAAIFRSSTEVTYKEYWVPHSQFTAGCDSTTGGSWYTEPGTCNKALTLNIPDDFSNALKTELYVDLWRAGRASGPAARFSVNGGTLRTATVGNEWSRSPYVVELPSGTFQQGSNTITFSAVPTSAEYHIHDVAVRIYHDASHPLVAGSGSDVTPPTGSLVDVAGTDASSGGTISVPTNDQLTLRATASGAAYVDFLGFYRGYDEDIDGQTTDWHGMYRHNWAPGGTQPKASGATIGHIGTATAATNGFHTVTWNLNDVADQSGVKFKVRLVDAAGNVRETAPSADFTLDRPGISTEIHTISSFVDAAIHHQGDHPDRIERMIELPDLANATSALLVGQFWTNPFISVNGNAAFKAFNSTCDTCGEDTWQLSKRTVPVSHLVPGTNTITYSYNPNQIAFGHFVEKPGPMILIKRQTGSGAPTISRHPADRAVPSGSPVVFSVTASGADTLTYQWQRNGVDVPGETEAVLRIAAANASDNQARYRVKVTNDQGSVTSTEATLTVAGGGAWWDQRWEYRLPIIADPGGFARSDAIVEVDVDFTKAYEAAGARKQLDVNSLRVVEVDAAGAVVDPTLVHQFEPVAGFHAVDLAKGKLVIQSERSWPGSAPKIFHVYFDEPAKNIPAPSFAPAVTLADSSDEGQASFRITTPTATYEYQKAGAALSSVVDTAGRDWVSHNSAAGSAGQFRGIPQFPSPEVHFHPGSTSAETTVLLSGPLRVVLSSKSLDNKWAYTTAFYPTHAVSKVTKIDKEHRYWFLYEGTPGGGVDSNDIVVRSNGTSNAITGSWSGDIVGDEWAYVGDKTLNRSIFLASNEDDGHADRYFQLNNQMVILGMGRSGTSTQLINEVNKSFTFGLIESTSYSTAKPIINGRYKPLVVGVGTGQRDLGPPLAPALSSVSVTPAATTATVRWTTLAPTSAVVRFGPTSAYGSQVTSSLKETHEVTLTGLSCESDHHFQIEVTDANGNKATSPDAAFRTAACTTLPLFVGDDFSPAPLNGDVWTEVDPLDDGTVEASGGKAVFTVPTGASHDAWTSGNRSLRIMQPVDGTDGTYEAKIDTVPKLTNQMIGLLVEESSSKWLRADFTYSTSSGLRLFMAGINGSTATTRSSSNIAVAAGTGPLWLRLTKAGSSWTVGWSRDGSTYNNLSPLSFGMTPTQAGIFAGNHNSTVSLSPEWTAEVDYVMDRRAPVPDDNDTTGPAISGVGFAATADAVTVSWSTNEAATTVLEHGPSTTYGAAVAGDRAVARHTASIAGLACGESVQFRITATDRDGNATRGTNLTAFTSACATSVISDEFQATTLGPAWKIFSPAGDVPPPVLTGTNIVVDLPAGSRHDLTSPYNAHRLLQFSPDVDLQLESKWETLPYAQFQSEGMIVQSGLRDFVRFELYHNGTQLRLYAASVIGGVATQRLDMPVALSGGVILRVTRIGSQWTLSYQPLGGALTQVATFSHTMVVNNVGVHVVNSASVDANSPSFAASLDYFRNLTKPIPADDVDVTPPIVSNVVVTPSPAHAVVTWTTNEPASSRVDFGRDATYGENRSSATRVLRHSVIVSPLTCSTDYHWSVTSTDVGAQSATSPDVVVPTSPCSAIESDNFNSTSLSGKWRYIDPKGDVPHVLTGSEFGFNLPAGSRHDMWQAALEAPRLLQTAPNTDFEIIARWTTAPSQRTQSEGMLVMQDPTNFVRFDIYSDGSATRAFAATFLNGAPTTRLNTVITTSSRYMQRIIRTGDSFTLGHSLDGVNWSNLATFSYRLGVNDVGVFATNTNSGGSPPAWQPRLTAFDNAASPSNPDDTTPPAISNVAFAMSGALPVVTWDTDEPASSKIEYGETDSFGSLAENGALVTAHRLELNQAACGRTYHYRITSIDGGNNSASTEPSTFELECPAGVQSDAFNTTSLDPRWTYVNPAGDVPPPRLTGTDVVFDIPCCASHDLWTNNMKAVQLVQSAPDDDFEVDAKWNSPVQKQYQFEGIVARQDATNLVRFDVVRVSSTTTRAFAASFVNGTATTRLSVATSVTAPVFQRVTRTGDTWTFKISANGTSWTTIGSFTHALAVTDVGVLAGNHHSTTSSVPAFSASLDYFHNTAMPLPDDGATQPGMLQNDDFSSGFNSSRWTFVDPRNGDATLQVTGGEAVISLPGGSGHDHDAYKDKLTVPRIEQKIDDVDFETEIKFGSYPSLNKPNQIQGLLVRESDTKWIRFDTQVVDNRFEIFAATNNGTEFTERVRKMVRGGSSFLLRVRRTGDTWSYSYAYDDQHWTPAVTFTYALDATAMGPFFGNVPPTGQSTSATPSFTGRVDYVVNRAMPFTQDDGVPYPPAPANPVIDVWYGDDQTFGQNGKPQQWVNLVGTVADFDGMKQLTYRLNGGAPEALTVGETDNRLAAPGDFNAEIDYAQLQPGANTVVLTAVDALDNQTTRTVTINNAYTGQAWPESYSIDWSGVSTPADINDVAQIADGKWILTPQGVRTGVTGYDRVIAVGDAAWENYEAVVDVTIHALHPRDNGAGIVAGWRGATTDNYGKPNGQQPRLGHPFPALGWYSKESSRLQRLNIYRNWVPQYETRLVEHPTYHLSLDITYAMKFRVEPNVDDPTQSRYSLKVWERGTTEPSQFQLTTLSARYGGSILLGAHRADVTFGDLTVTALDDVVPPSSTTTTSTTSSTTTTTSSTTTTTSSSTTTTTTDSGETTTTTAPEETTTTTAAPTGSDAVLLTGNAASLPNADVPLRGRLESLGWTVRAVDDDSLGSTSALDGAALVVISSSVVPSKIPSWVGSHPAPIVNGEAYAQTRLRIASTGKEESSKTTLRIADPGHPLAAGLSGDVIVQASNPMGVATPVASADVVAGLPGASTASIYAIESGDALTSGTAPARRVGFFLSYNSPPSMTASGWSLFDAAVEWATA